MKKYFISFVGLFLIFCLAGCKSANSSAAGNMTLYPSTIGPLDAYRPLYEVDETKRVSGTANVNVLFGLFAWGDGSGIADNASIFNNSGMFAFVNDLFPNAKNMAAKAAFYNACKEAKCDAVVAASYDIQSTDYLIFSKSKVTVTGFPAVQKGVETVKVKPYYVDNEGKMVWLDKFIIPVEILNLSMSGKSLLGDNSGFLSGLF